MTLEPGDIVDGRWLITAGPVAVWRDGRGWVCPYCDEPCNSYGHGHEGCQEEGKRIV